MTVIFVKPPVAIGMCGPNMQVLCKGSLIAYGQHIHDGDIFGEDIIGHRITMVGLCYKT